jgi:hypothetical protein
MFLNRFNELPFAARFGCAIAVSLAVQLVKHAISVGVIVWSVLS